MRGLAAQKHVARQVFARIAVFFVGKGIDAQRRDRHEALHDKTQAKRFAFAIAKFIGVFDVASGHGATAQSML